MFPSTTLRAGVSIALACALLGTVLVGGAAASPDAPTDGAVADYDAGSALGVFADPGGEEGYTPPDEGGGSADICFYLPPGGVCHG